MGKFLQLFALLTIGLLQNIFSQNFIGYTTGNYAGVNSLMYNPANVVDSRFRADVNLMTANIGLGNNFMSVNWKNLTNPNFYTNFDFSKDIEYSRAMKPYNLFVNTSIELPGAMVSLTKKDAIALVPRFRTFVNIDGLEKPLMDMILSTADAPNWFQKDSIINRNLQIQTNTWMEYAFTYGRVLMDRKEHFLKGGLTIKLLQGLGAANISVNNLYYSFPDNDTLTALVLNAQYGHSSNFDYKIENLKFAFISQPSAAFDVGFIYEWRPKYAKYQYDMDGQSGLWRRDQNKYKLRIGVSATDLGAMKYKKDSSSYNFSIDQRNIPLSAFNLIQGVATLDSTIRAIQAQRLEDKGYFYKTLPMAFSLQADWNIWKGFYLNATAFVSMNPGYNNPHKNRYWNNYTLTPRYEHQWFGIYLPNAYNSLNNWNSGISLRVGPMTIGSGTIISNLAKNKLQNFDLFFGFKGSIPYGKPKDRDNDKVSDKKDKCKKVPGVWKFAGCPDTDRDGIEDAKDACPKDSGLAIFNGCPDSDNDGIINSEDACPNDSGPKELAGCPDSDNDKIADKDDECPTQKGLAEFGGCPDTDADGIKDLLDKCPTLPGPKEKFGCPDKDDDGVTDDKDNCPDEPGLSENFGCPYKDTDKDGVRDIDDRCPDKPGPASLGGCPVEDRDSDGIADADDKCPDLAGVPENSGCPPLPPEVKEVISKAFSNLEFAPAKAIIRTTSYNSLDELAKLLKDKPEYKLLLEGHTDNKGSRESNMTLSKNRANAVKAYLVKKGVSATRITTKWYGPDKPVAGNDTPEGMQKNRRVEMILSFK
jgi:outer membrane protein OmpA-like peptidoglycan-associated protein